MLVRIGTFSELICEVLVNFGVTHIFGGHGGAIVGLIDAIVAHPKLTWVYTRCEVSLYNRYLSAEGIFCLDVHDDTHIAYLKHK